MEICQVPLYVVFSHVYILMQPARLCAYIFLLFVCLKCVVYGIVKVVLVLVFIFIHVCTARISVQVL